MATPITPRGTDFRALIWKSRGYEPSTEQAEFHYSPARFRLVAGGVRAGKSMSTAMECHRYTATPGGLGWLVAPDYEQARPEFDYLFQCYKDLGLIDDNSVSYPSRGSCKFSVNWREGKFTWITKSSTDPVSLASYAPDVVVMCEAAQQTHEAFLKCLERATQKNAPVILSGTFESSLGWYADLWERWQGINPEAGVSFSLPTWSNLAEFPAGRVDPKLKSIEATMPPDLFQERYGGVPCKPKGLVFPQFDRKLHLRRLSDLYDDSLPVELWVDPATHTYACLFVQLQGDTVHILDEVYEHNAIAQDVIPLVLESRFWPHVKTGVIDIAAKQRQGNKSQLQVWDEELKRYGAHPISWKMNYIKEEIWRQAIALRLKPPGRAPLLYFADHLNTKLDSTGRAYGVLGEIITYKWPQYVEGRSMVGRPVKQNEDALSALGYGLVNHFGAVIDKKKPLMATARSYWR